MRFPNIEAERARIGMTNVELAKALDVSEMTIYNWRRSGRYPLPALVKMSKLFGCSLEYLAQTDDSKEENK